MDEPHAAASGGAVDHPEDTLRHGPVPWQKAMVAELAPLVGALRCSRGQRLHGIFVSDETTSKQPDAENIAFYNFGSQPFAGAGSTLAFERSYSEAPPPPRPLDAAAPYYHAWSVVPDDAPFEHWREGDVVAGWNEVPLALRGDLGLGAWRALREHPECVTVTAELGPSDAYGVDVTLSAPHGQQQSIVTALKGLVDGPLAALQRSDHLDPDVVARLLARRWGRPIDAATLRRLAAATVPRPVLPRAPFNRNGLDPCDELCVAGIARVVAGGAAGQALLTGRIFRVQAR